MDAADRKGPAARQRKSVNEQMAELQGEIRKIAARQMARERPDHTLQPTALVNEAYLKLCRQENLQGASRATFLAAAAQTMRRILIDHARLAGADKRGGGRERVTLSDAEIAVQGLVVDLIDLEEALARLEKESERVYNVVVCRYLAAMTMPEISEGLGIPLRTVEDDWAFAKAWLRKELDLKG